MLTKKNTSPVNEKSGQITLENLNTDTHRLLINESTLSPTDAQGSGALKSKQFSIRELPEA